MGNPNHDPKTGEFSSRGGGAHRIMAHRSAGSVAGAASRPLKGANGEVKTFATHEAASAEAERLNRETRSANVYYSPYAAEVPTTHVHHSPDRSQMTVPLNTKRNIGTDAAGAYHGTVIRKGKEIRVVVPPNTKRRGY